MSADTSTAAPAIRWNGIFNIVGGLAIFIQDYLVHIPNYKGQFPPGGAILGVIGILVLLLAVKFRWIVILGFIAPAFISLGGLAQKGIFPRMVHPGAFGYFSSTWLQWIGMVLAIIFGIIGIISLFRRTRTTVAA